MADKDYQTVLIEQLVDQNKAVLEAVSDMQKQVALIPAIREDITELKQDMKVVKAAVTDLSNQVHDHERRITRLEAAQRHCCTQIVFRPTDWNTNGNDMTLDDVSRQLTRGLGDPYSNCLLE